MSHRLKVAALALVFPLAACSGTAGDGSDATSDSEVSPTSTFGRPAADFQSEETDPSETTEIQGERVKDPAMDLSYKWQGTSSAPGGGTIVVVAVTNESDAAMPADTLKPKLEYNSGDKNFKSAQPLDAETAGVDMVGLDMPLGPGATSNLKLPFDVSTGNLWDARFTIGNVTFKGNLNN